MEQSATSVAMPDLAGRWSPSFLLICDEWSPTRGGISTFNRAMATALAAAGYRTMCLVMSASPCERADAVGRGVKLITATDTPSGPNLFVRSDEAIRTMPDVVVGHDRISGSVAWTYSRLYRQATLVHIVHTAPSEIEPYKSGCDATRRIEEREQFTRRMAAAADVIGAVGPRLTSDAELVVTDGFGGVSVLQLEPGIDVPTDLCDRHRLPPARPTVLLLGRADEVELKGLDIAAGALADISGVSGTPLPKLFVRGPTSGDCGMLHHDLVQRSGLARDRIDVRPFTDDIDEIRHDLHRAAVCVMPSRVEGFGLVALEAISVGTPVLVSSKSGVAESLRSHLGTFARPMIVEVADDHADATRLSSAIQQILADLPAAFQYAHEVRARLKGRMNWDAMISTLITRLRTQGRVPVQDRGVRH